eukprot:3522556-Pyramimonas_sp.AAC.1
MQSTRRAKHRALDPSLKPASLMNDSAEKTVGSTMRATARHGVFRKSKENFLAVRPSQGALPKWAVRIRDLVLRLTQGMAEL